MIKNDNFNKIEYDRYKEDISNKYIEDYLTRYHNYKPKTNITCIYANTHAKGTDKKASMGFMENERKLHCFTCNGMANIFDLVRADTNNKTDREVITYLKGIYPQIEFFKNNNQGKNDNLGQNRTITPIQPVKEIPNVEINTEYEFTDLIDKANELVLKNDKHDSLSMYGYKYYTSRGLTEEIIKKFKLGVVNNINDILINYPNLKSRSKKADLYKLILPILDEQGNCYNFIGEICNRKEIDAYNDKYKKLSSAGGITTQLFNEYYLKDNKPKTIFITEGIYDALSIEQEGFNSIALIGVGNTRFLNLIKTYKPNVNLVIMLDNDPTGKKTTITFLKELENLNQESIKFINGIDILENYKDIKKYKDSNEMLLNNEKEFKEFLIANYKIINKNEDIDRIDNANVSNSLDYFRNIENQPPVKIIPTNFMNLDKKLKGGLRNGLYVIGAVSNLGKTAFTTQLADQIAKQGQPVLYFSLEMDKKELIARSIARTTYMQVNDKKDKYGNAIASNTYEILDNIKYNEYEKEKKDVISVSIEIYENIAKNLYIISGRYKKDKEMRRYNINDIEKVINDFIKYQEKTPVIFIDYMQIIAPTDIKMTDKQNMDEIVDRLKQISIDLETPVIVISSYNRDNYYEPANVSAFKESGSIEYGADIIMALQYQGIDEIYYDNSKSKTEQQKKREIYELIESYKYKSSQGENIPIQLKVLKSRNSSKFNMNFEFKAQYGCFKETTINLDTTKIPQISARKKL